MISATKFVSKLSKINIAGHTFPRPALWIFLFGQVSFFGLIYYCSNSFQIRVHKFVNSKMIFAKFTLSVKSKYLNSSLNVIRRNDLVTYPSWQSRMKISLYISCSCSSSEVIFPFPTIKNQEYRLHISKVLEMTWEIDEVNEHTHQGRINKFLSSHSCEYNLQHVWLPLTKE